MDGYGPDAVAAGTLVAVALIALVLCAASYVIICFPLMSVFRKAGANPVLAWIPFANSWVLFTLGDVPGWLSIIPVANVIGAIITVVNVTKKFGRSGGIAVLGIFLPWIWVFVLGLGKARWQGNVAVATDAWHPDVPTAGVAPYSAPYVGGQEHPQPAYRQTPDAASAGQTTSAGETGDAVDANRADAVRRDWFEPAPFPTSQSAWAPPVDAQVAPSIGPAPVPRWDTPAELGNVAPETMPLATPAVPAAPSVDAGAEDEDDETVFVRRSSTPVWTFVTSTGQTLDVAQGDYILGRKPVIVAAFPDAEPLRIEDPQKTVSKVHAHLVWSDERSTWIIEDLDSTNGVYLGDELDEIPSHQPAVLGTVLYLGELRLAMQRPST